MHSPPYEVPCQVDIQSMACSIRSNVTKAHPGELLPPEVGVARTELFFVSMIQRSIYSNRKQCKMQEVPKVPRPHGNDYVSRGCRPRVAESAISGSSRISAVPPKARSGHPKDTETSARYVATSHRFLWVIVFTFILTAI